MKGTQEKAQEIRPFRFTLRNPTETLNWKAIIMHAEDQ